MATTNLRQKIDVFGEQIFIVALPFRNVLEYRNDDEQVHEKRVECGYIVYKFGEIWFSSSGVPFAYFCICVKNGKISISGRLSENMLERS